MAASDVNPGVEVVGPPATRLVYVLLQGGGHSNPNYRYRWSCPACGYFVDEDEKSRDVAQTKADAHKCDYGWCAVPIDAERTMLAAISPFRFNFTVTNDDRARWEERRRRNRDARRRQQQLQAAADRTRDRVVPFP